MIRLGLWAPERVAAARWAGGGGGHEMDGICTRTRTGRGATMTMTDGVRAARDGRRADEDGGPNAKCFFACPVHRNVWCSAMATSRGLSARRDRSVRVQDKRGV